MGFLDKDWGKCAQNGTFDFNIFTLFFMPINKMLYLVFAYYFVFTDVSDMPIIDI